jgi:hypothetical protein
VEGTEARLSHLVHSESPQRATLVNIAVVRELAGFCWAIATAD